MGKRERIFYFFLVLFFLPCLSFSESLPADSLLVRIQAAGSDAEKIGIIQELLNSREDKLQSQVQKVVFLSLIPFTLAFSFFVFVFYRSRRESDIHKLIAQVEMKALRAQINPHFIYNCLGSIRLYMEQNNLAKAGEYLSMFSKLIRTVLENSMRPKVTLNEDLRALRLYIQLEQLRYCFKFDFHIKLDPLLNEEKVLVPPLIIQPFIENSILHGLKHKPGNEGLILIDITQDEKSLKYVITDNGVKQPPGTEKETGIRMKEKSSLGLSITRERLNLLHGPGQKKGEFHLHDILDNEQNYAGKKVELTMPLELISK